MTTFVRASCARRYTAVSRSGDSRPSGPPAPFQVDGDVHAQAGRGRDVAGQALDGGRQPQVVERGGPQLRDERAQLADLVRDALEQAIERAGDVGRGGQTPDGDELHPQRRQPLQRLVVQLAGPAAPLLLGAVERVAQPLLPDGLGGGDRGGGRRGEGEQQLLLPGGERRQRAVVVERHEDAQPTGAEDEGDEQRVAHGPGAERGGGHPARTPRVEHLAGHRGRAVDGVAGGEGLAVAGDGRHAQRPVVLGQEDRRGAGVDERPPALGDEVEDAVQVGLGADGAGDRGRGGQAGVDALELVVPLPQPVVQPCVRHGDGRPVGEDDERLLVRGGERAAGPLGQVQVAPRPAAHQDRHAEERRHRRVGVGDAEGPRVRRQVVDAQRRAGADDLAEQAVPARRVADRALLLGAQAAREEAAQPAPVVVEDAEGGVARARQLLRGGEDVLEERVGVELADEGAADGDQAAQARLVEGGGRGVAGRGDRGGGGRRAGRRGRGRGRAGRRAGRPGGGPRRGARVVACRGGQRIGHEQGVGGVGRVGHGSTSPRPRRRRRGPPRARP
ncbi:hypothetical protein [Patulibacter sp. SYSU D01012]|uniref:hypothetical protein n=1 Tax=Patulibacter sp. SYSU D01012 TaxID=2817381 RepID=UPI001FEDAB2B|nr:hypothetical protein [Patulibacter sp. SYSU D01012]